MTGDQVNGKGPYKDVGRGRPGVAAALLFCFIMLGCGKTPDKPPPTPPIKVSAAIVEEGDVDRSIQASGVLTFTANTTVSSEVSAQVKSIEAADGQHVFLDQLLLVFDETKIKETANHANANLQKNQAVLEFNTSELQKSEELRKTGSISHTSYDQKLSSYKNSLAQVEADKAALAKALEDLKKTLVRAPIEGLISRRYVEKGDWISEGTKMFLVSDFKKVYLEAFLSDKDIGKLDVKKVISEGMSVDLAVDSYPGARWKGRLTHIQPLANDAGLFQVRVYTDNTDMKLLQGMFARAGIVYDSIKGVRRIPVTSLLEQIVEQSENSVFVVNPQKKAERKHIRIGARNSRYVEVTEGLLKGEPVVTRGKDILTEGQPVEIEKIDKQAGPDKSGDKSEGSDRAG
jgi:membrane fusion protein, multidrug efflux system